MILLDKGLLTQFDRINNIEALGNLCNIINYN